MDLSKLPRFSKTDPPPPAPGEPPQKDPVPPEYCQTDADTVIGAEVWIGLVIAVILILFFPRFWQYYLFPSSFTWTFTDKAGAALPYPQTAFYLVDLGIALFAVAMIIDAVALIFRRSLVARGIALAVTAGAALLNLVVFAAVMKEIGTQLMPILATGFAVYTAIYQWTGLKRMLAVRAAAKA